MNDGRDGRRRDPPPMERDSPAAAVPPWESFEAIKSLPSSVSMPHTSSFQSLIYQQYDLTSNFMQG